MKKKARITAKWIARVINDFIVTSPSNSMQFAGEPAWDSALVGFAAGSDQIWQQYKEYIGAFHWTPWEVFNQHRPAERRGDKEPAE